MSSSNDVDVATLLNSASIATDAEKIELLASAFELMFHRDSALMNEYYSSLIQFALDSTVQIKKQIIGFIETTCKARPQFIIKSKDILKYLLGQSQQVIKRTILCFTNLVRSLLSYTLTSPNSDAGEVWNSFNEIRKYILDSSCSNLSISDATMANSLKLLEMLCLCFSLSNEAFAPIGGGVSSSTVVQRRYRSDDEFSLDRVPNTHNYLNRSQLQKDCTTYLNTMLDHIVTVDSMTSTNIMMLITSLTTICRQRLSLIKQILPQLCQCTENLPKFNTIQNESIKHTIKTCLLSILKLKNTLISPYVRDLSKALSSIDVSPKEIEEASRWYRGEPEKKKRQNESSASDSSIKKLKYDQQVQQQQQQVQQQIQQQQQFQLQNNNNINNNNNSPNIYKPGLYLDHETQSRVISSIESLRPEFVADLIIDNMSISPLFSLLQKVQHNPNTDKLFQFVHSYQQASPLIPPFNQIQNPNQNQNQPPFLQLSPPINAAPSSSIVAPPAFKMSTSAGVGADPRRKGDSPPYPGQPDLDVPNPSFQDTPMDFQPLQPLPSSAPKPADTLDEEEQDQEPELDQLLEKEELDKPPEESAVSEGMSNGKSGAAKHEPVHAERETASLPVEVAQTFTPSPSFKLPTLSSDQINSIISRSMSRLKQSEKGAVIGGKKLLWSSLFARLLSASEDREKDKDEQSQIIEFILEDFVNRRELALQWLQNEYQMSMELTEDETDSNNRYAQLLINIVKKLQAKYAFDDDQQHQMIVSDFILEVPVITPGLMDHIALCCNDTTLVMLGLNTLLSLIIWRPISRDGCLQCLFDHSADHNESIRSNTVRVLRDELFKYSSLSQKIEAFVTEQLLSILPQPDDQSVHQDKQTINNKLRFYFSICEKKPSLLNEVIECFPRFVDSVKDTILDMVGPVVASIGQDDQSLLQLIKLCPTGSEKLMYQVVDSLSTSRQTVAAPEPESDAADAPAAPVQELPLLSKEFVQSVRTLSNTTKDIKFLLPVVNGLDKAEIIDLLPTFVLPTSDNAKFVEMMSMKHAPLSPSELLVQLHLIMNADNTIPVIQTIDTCIKNTEVFKQETLAVTIQQLIVQSTLPKTLMRTMLQALQKFPHLKQFIVDMLRELVAKQIWQEPQLWKGFLLCASKSAPDSLTVILDLPSTQFELAITDSPEIKSLLTKFLKTIKDPTHYSRNNLRLLGYQPTANKK